MELGVGPDRRRDCCWRRSRASPGTSMPRSACWSAAAASASATPASRCSCPTGSCAAAAWRSGIAFAGVGVGSIVLLPWRAERDRALGWRTACWPWACSCWSCWCRSISCCGGARKTWACGPTATPRRRPRGAAEPANVVDPAWAAVDWTLARAMRTAPLLVDRASAILRPVRLVRGAGAPDQVPDRDRLQPDARRLGARAREPGRHPGPDRARPPVGPHRPRMGLDGRQRWASRSATWRCSLLQAYPDTAAAVPDGRRAGRARLRR